MPRPPCCRRVSGLPAVALFVPQGCDVHQLEQVAMTLDELEAIKLADLEGLYQEDAAARMGVSRPTFGRIVASARRKAADALVSGKALRIEGGTISAGRAHCQSCKLEWEQTASEMGRCPRCHCPARAERIGRALYVPAKEKKK